MNYTTTLSLLGIMVSALFGTWGIIIAIRNRYPGRITYVKEQTIELFDAIGKNLPDLAVMYKNQTIKQNLVLINGAFLNTGKIDISSAMTEVPITLSLPEGFKWITAKVVSTSKEVKASIDIKDENNIILEHSLFRCKEYIRFQALAEVPMTTEDENNEKKTKMGNHLEDALSFSHRIMNTKKIDQRKISEQEVYKRRKKLYLRILAFTTIAVIALGLLSFRKGFPSQFIYDYNNESGDSCVVTIQPLNNNKVKINDLEGKFKVETNLNDCFAHVIGNPKITSHKKIFKVFSMIAILYIGLPLLSLMVAYIANQRNSKLIQILEL